MDEFYTVLHGSIWSLLSTLVGVLDIGISDFLLGSKVMTFGNLGIILELCEIFLGH